MYRVYAQQIEGVKVGDLSGLTGQWVGKCIFETLVALLTFTQCRPKSRINIEKPQFLNVSLYCLLLKTTFRRVDTVSAFRWNLLSWDQLTELFPFSGLGPET
jgi:hypothetical protein